MIRDADIRDLGPGSHPSATSGFSTKPPRNTAMDVTDINGPRKAPVVRQPPEAVEGSTVRPSTRERHRDPHTM